MALSYCHPKVPPLRRMLLPNHVIPTACLTPHFRNSCVQQLPGPAGPRCVLESPVLSATSHSQLPRGTMDRHADGQHAHSQGRRLLQLLHNCFSNSRNATQSPCVSAKRTSHFQSREEHVLHSRAWQPMLSGTATETCVGRKRSWNPTSWVQAPVLPTLSM